MILGVNLGYHSKKLYPLINDQYTCILSVRMKLLVLPLVHSLKTYDSTVLVQGPTISLAGGVMVFSFVQNFFFGQHESQNIFLLSRKARIFFPEFNIRLYDKNSESDYFFFLHQNQNILFSNIGNQNICLEKKHTPPPFSS